MNTTEKRNGFLCFDCSVHAPFYMVRNEIWAKAFPDYRQKKRELRARYPPGKEFVERYGRACRFISLCLDCLARRLGRPLEFDDFMENVEHPLLKLCHDLGKKDAGRNELIVELIKRLEMDEDRDQMTVIGPNYYREHRTEFLAILKDADV